MYSFSNCHVLILQQADCCVNRQMALVPLVPVYRNTLLIQHIHDKE